MDHKHIVIITSEPAAAETAKSVMREFSVDYPVVLAELEELREVSRRLVDEGVRVIIAFGLFAKVIRQSVDIPVIMVDLLPEDVLDGLLRASRIGNRIAIFGFKKVLRDVLTIRELLRIELIDIPTVMPDQLPEKFRSLTDVDVVVGGYYQAKIASQYHLPYVLVEPRASEIAKAISMAQAHMERTKENGSVGSEVVPNSSIYAFLTLDRQGNIILLNRLASEYLNISHLTQVSFSMESVCPQFTRVSDVLSNGQAYLNQVARIGDKVFLYHAEPIFNGEKLEGVSVTFQDAETVRGAEISIRRNLAASTNQTRYSLDQIIGRSASMSRALKMATRFARAEETVLILGETGVGKELFAQGIHSSSSRANGPFVAINCASLPESILESELFGYVRGAFTGANREGKRGLFENAHTGTIFLDEIGELSPALQGKLLRVLQERNIRRIGGENLIPVDIRVIAATNCDLVSMVREGSFRGDLYFRLNVLCLHIPPLRERREDIVLLAEYFLAEAALHKHRSFSFTEEARRAMREYDWPGNVRELQNMVQRVAVITDTPQIEEWLIRNYMEENSGLSAPRESKATEPPKRYTLEEALERAGGNKQKAAELLGVSRATFYRMLKRKEP
ncbi:MAG: sigma 54-interacting transcriptional regulator [Oscillospiraceae bacterium]|nr:sigma 54-interacting transcriptional regulator [Oscillospiraceae bacterium]